MRFIAPALAVVSAFLLAAFQDAPSPSAPQPSNTITVTRVPPPASGGFAPHAGLTSPGSIGTPHSCPGFYPPIALRLAQEGTTMLGFTIKPDGSVTDVTVLNSSGHDTLDQAAVICASQWRYRPATQNGTPVATKWRANVKWTIAGFDMSFFAFYGAGLSCALNEARTASELDQVKGPTLIDLVFANGALASATVTRSSGNPTLDRRATDCFNAVAPDMTKSIVGQRSYIVPVFWWPTAPGAVQPQK